MVVFGFGLAMAGSMGLGWVLTLDPAQFPGGLPLDLGRALGPPDFKTDMQLEAWQVRGLVFGAAILLIGAKR